VVLISYDSDILFLIRCVHAGLVLREVVNKFGMDTDGAGSDACDVPGERSGLVGGDYRGACHRLTRTENTNDEFFLSHSPHTPFHGESKRKSRHGQEALQNSDSGLVVNGTVRSTTSDDQWHSPTFASLWQWPHSLS